MKKDFHENLNSLSREELIARVKELSSQRKFGLVWEDKPEEVAELCEMKLPVLNEVAERHIKRNYKGTGDCAAGSLKNGSLLGDDGSNLPTHLIIEGDNYHALSVLNYTHAGKVDVIYIDPPYNTGAKDWKYNNNYVESDDAFRHSKWLSFMEKRLRLAKNLLKDDGSLICAIDDYELNTLGLLLDELFPELDKSIIVVEHHPQGTGAITVSRTHEYAYILTPQGLGIEGKEVYAEEQKWSLKRSGQGENNWRINRPNSFFAIHVDEKTRKVVGVGPLLKKEGPYPRKKVHEGILRIYPLDKNGGERVWRYNRKSMSQLISEGMIEYTKGGSLIVRKNGAVTKPIFSVWTGSRYNAGTNGSNLLSQILDKVNTFPYPKSLYTVLDMIAMIIKNRPNAKILDFFAGSGTTGHAVLELNAADGGNRQFILCTNNENGIAENVTYPRIKKVIEGYGDKEGIPAEVRYFTTDFVEKIEPPEITDDDRINFASRAGAMIAVKENCFYQIEFNKTWQIFENHEKMVAVYFQESKSQMKNLLKKIGDKRCVLYIFSWGGEGYSAEYGSENIEVKEIPEPILAIYKQIHRRKK